MSIEPIIGRYVTVTIGGVEQRIYFEEAGRAVLSCACTLPVPIHVNGAIC